MHEQSDDPENRDDYTSKSARKREMQALQDLGREIIELPDSQFSQLPLSEEIVDAIALYKRLTQREARRRQLQRIGKLMRQEDSDAIHGTLAGFRQHDLLFRQHFHRVETLRDQLIADGDTALAPLLDQHADLDVQFIRQLIRQARQEDARGKPPAASRKLFRYLRETLPVTGT